ncbi:MAG: TIGR03905 family TSCPD domain-containing protein [Anaerotignum sp.]|nr:TIGR03905 family TSCPD domain-containing protein [Anaerotignum sp.]
MHVKYDTKGICAVRVEFDVEDGVVKNISFLGGCDGNHKGLAVLAEGMTLEEAARRLKGITCGRRSTSCPDQLALALEDYMAKQ